MPAVILALIFGAIGVTVLGCIWGGYVASIIWGWFAVPIFGARPISIPEAIGLGTIISCFIHSSAQSKDGEEWVALASVAFRPAFVLFVAWIAKGFV